MLTWGQRCSILWLPIGILYGAKCGCEYTFNSLLLIWIDGWICQFCGPSWLPNSMPLNLFWPIGIPSSYSCGWSINALATFYNSTCLAIPTLMWKGTKGQSMIACPSIIENSHNNMNIKFIVEVYASLYYWKYESKLQQNPITTTKCGCNSLVLPIHKTSEFIASSLVLVHYN